MSDVSAIIIHIGKFSLQIQQSILVWLGICVFFAFFFYFAGKKIEKQDPSKASKGIVYICEEIYNLVLYVIKDNLRETTKKYIPMFGTLIVLMIQGNGIKKGGLLARMKELTEPMFLLTPLNVIGELALPISLTMRLFGNILAGYIISMLVYTLIKMLMPIGLLGLLVTPFLHMYFDIFSGVIQTYIFFTLSSFFLGQQVVIQED